MSEADYGESAKALPADDAPGPIRILNSRTVDALSRLEKSLAKLQMKLQPVLREEANVRSVPKDAEDLGQSDVAREMQNHLHRIEGTAERVEELIYLVTI